MKKTAHIVLALTFGFSAALASAASDPHAAHMAGHGTATTAQAAAKSEGEIKKIDKQAGKITIKHGPLANLDMPPMTMAFAVKDAAVLDSLKVGDKIRFVAEKNGPSFQATQVERVK